MTYLTASKDALARVLAEHRLTTPVQCACGWRETDPDAGTHAEHVASLLPVIPADTLADDKEAEAAFWREQEAGNTKRDRGGYYRDGFIAGYRALVAALTERSQ